MNKSIISFAILVIFLSGCASFPSKGITESFLVTGEIPLELQNLKNKEKSLTRAKNMVQAGALIEATLYTTGYSKLKTLSEARRTKDTEEDIKNKFKEIEKIKKDNMCFLVYLKHASIDLAKPERWKLKASVNDGEWKKLELIPNNMIPDYTVNSEWYSTAMFCEKSLSFKNAKKIKLNVFPPVFVNPGEAMLEWDIQ
ncbi:MAG: hypothetical protein L6420_07940 [Elusimicrobia bacterium]|nr:hypothetical protein [Elusimicrobiota bacterium]